MACSNVYNVYTLDTYRKNIVNCLINKFPKLRRDTIVHILSTLEENNNIELIDIENDNTPIYQMLDYNIKTPVLPKVERSKRPISRTMYSPVSLFINEPISTNDDEEGDVCSFC